MKNVISILGGLYDNVSDAVYAYSVGDQMVYHNKASRDVHLDQNEITKKVLTTLNKDNPHQHITIKGTEYKVKVSFIALLDHQLQIVILTAPQLNSSGDLAEEVKNILLKTSITDQSFYERIGEFIKGKLDLSNLHIIINDIRKNDFVIKYSSKGEYSKKSNLQYVTLAKHIVAKADRKILYTNEEFNEHLSQPLGFACYLFIPIKSKASIIGGIGIFASKQANEILPYEKALESIAEYLGLFYGNQHLEESLLQQTSRLNAIFESSSDLIWSVDRSMEVVSFNQNYFRAIFYKYQGGIVTEHLSNGSSNTSPFDEFWESKYQEVFKGNALNFEIELKHPNNAPVWKEIFLMPIYQASGIIDEVSGIAKDISDKKKTVTALHKEEEKFKQIFESFQDLYIKVDLKGIINMISPSVTAMMGYKIEEVVGQNVDDYYLYNIRTKSLFRKIFQSKTLRNIDIDLIGKAGNIIPCICNLRIIHNRLGQPIAIEGICRDITEIKIANEELVLAKNNLEISLRAKEQFLANMSHEIRTPMNGIIGLLDMVLGTELTKHQTTYLSTIKQSSKLLLNLLNDILDLSKINAGKLNINNDDFSIRNLTNNIQTLFSSEIEQKQLNFSIIIDDSVPEYISSDKLRLLQIFSNLISNAIKFTSEAGDIKIEVMTAIPSHIKVNVIDTGIGIDSKNVKKLFNNFTQINDSYSKQYSGAGLGLAISKSLVKLLGGEIGVQSIPGKGSDFWFTFKVNSSISKAQTQPTSQHINLEESSYRIQNKTILVVDDNSTNRLVAREILKKFNAHVEEVASGLGAIEKVQKNSYDFILMDIQMPGMDGIEAMNRIKKINPKQIIIAMTAYDEKNQSEAFINMDFDGYLPKPITPKTLIEAITEVKSSDSQKTYINSSSYNMAVIKQLSKFVDSDSMQTTYHQFEVDLVDHIGACKLAFNNESYVIIGNSAHSIKGDASTLGLEMLADQAKKIEENIEHSHFSTLEDDLKTLYLMSVEIPQIIKEILNRLSHE